MRSFILVLMVVTLALAACGPQGGEAVAIDPTATLLPIVSHTPRYTATPAPTWTPLPTFTFTPTETLVPPTETLSPTPTLTPTISGIVQSLQRVNVREGPGTSFDAFASLPPGTGVIILGRDNEGEWLNIRMEDGDEGWIAARLVFLPPTPTAFPSPTPSPDLTALFLGTPLPTAVIGGGTFTPTPPRSVTTATPESEDAQQANADTVTVTTTPEDRSFIPVVDLDSINMTATALVASVITSTPTPEAESRDLSIETPTSQPGTEAATPEPESTEPETEATEAEAEPSPTDSGITQEEVARLTGVDVFAFCDEGFFGIPAPSNLATGSTIDIFWAWFARTEQQVRDHINAANIELTVNGNPVENVQQFRTRIRQVEGGDYVTYWFVPFGPLSAGNYTIRFRQTWDRQISDGYASYGPGTSTTLEEHTCTFTVR